MHSLHIYLPIWKFTRCLKFKAPECWNKLSKSQLLQLVEVLFLMEGTAIEKKSRATKILFEMKWWHFFLLTGTQLAYLNTYSKWVVDPESELRLTENLISDIKVGPWHSKKKLVGPLGGFETLKGAEWTAADSAFMSFLETNDEENLNDLVAILFRERDEKADHWSHDFKGDLRIPYNPHTVERRSNSLKSLDRRVKYAVLMWYKCCREEWESMYDKVFQGGTKEQVETYGWKETIQKVSGKLFGNLRETEDTYMYEILLSMQIEIKDYNYWKSKNDNHGRL